jgi:hypothetical protein
MLDVVLDLALDAWLEREHAAALALASQQIAHAEQHAALVRRLYGNGDRAHAQGCDELAERLWTAARALSDGITSELAERA